MRVQLFFFVFSFFSTFTSFGMTSEHITINANVDSQIKANSKSILASDSLKTISKKKKFEPLAVYGAITSLISVPLIVLGISSILSIPLLIGLAGVVMSILALLKIRNNKLKGKGLAIFGILFPILFSVLLIGFVIWALGRIGAGGK
jgi:hypothetical protein